MMLMDFTNIAVQFEDDLPQLKLMIGIVSRYSFGFCAPDTTAENLGLFVEVQSII